MLVGASIDDVTHMELMVCLVVKELSITLGVLSYGNFVFNTKYRIFSLEAPSIVLTFLIVSSKFRKFIVCMVK